MENLAQYLSDGGETIVKQALKATLKNPLESAFILKYMAAQKKASERRLRSEAEGLHIPPFIIASISSQCNLFCAGCYARANKTCGGESAGQLGAGEWARLFQEAATLGVSFILLAGGEPMLRMGVLREAAAVSDIVFPVFTNGTLFDREALALFHKHRNLVPILSLEGKKEETEGRRGAGVFDKLTDAMVAMKAKGILFGVSITVTAENVLDVTADAFVENLSGLGCKVVLLVEYSAPHDGADVSGMTELDKGGRARLAQRLEHMREQFDEMVFIAFPGDEEEFGGCLAAGRGFFHINPSGGAEPCPFSPFSDTSVKSGSLVDALRSPLFQKLSLGGFLQVEHLGGCALAGREEEIKALMAR
jgi:MoaA/NifB/PqqE/SkfB family radical SAM enzyme